MPLIHMRQPSGSNLCGQTCVAMAAGISLEESIAAFGTEKATTVKQVRKAMQKLGLVVFKDELKKWPSSLKGFDGKFLVYMAWHGTADKPKTGHWVLYWDGTFYDPACERAGQITPGGRIVSFMSFGSKTPAA